MNKEATRQDLTTSSNTSALTTELIMCRVNYFLGCIKLETFGLLFGWFYFCVSLIYAFFSVLDNADDAKDEGEENI